MNNCAAAWQFVDKKIKIEKCQVKDLTTKEYDWVTFILAYAAVVNSIQRQGAISNMTELEYEEGQLVGELYAVRVHTHKTAQTGSAVIMFNKQLKRRTDLYIQHVRPTILCNAVVGNEGVLFLTISGQKIVNISQRLNIIGSALGFSVYSPSEVRRTYAAKNFKGEDRSNMTKQMRHSVEVHENHYSMVQSLEQAVDTYNMLRAPPPAQPAPPHASPQKTRLLAGYHRVNIGNPTEGSAVVPGN